jgi:hypothetical protein
MSAEARRHCDQPLPSWVYAVVFLVTLAGSIKTLDVSPILWIDTVFEFDRVEGCLREGACTTRGPRASFEGIYHMVGWLHFWVFLEWLGLDQNGTHVLIQVANSLKIVLVMLVANRVGGGSAGALAPFFAFATGASPGALYDSSLMPFLGAVILVQLVAAAGQRPSSSLVVLAALGSAVVAEFHLAGVLTLVSVIWVVLLHPPDRVRRAKIGVTAFAVAVLVISPNGVISNLIEMPFRVFTLMAGLADGVAPSPAHQLVPFSTRLWRSLAYLFFLVPWALCRLAPSRFGSLHPGLKGALAVSVPLALVFSIGVLLGVFPAYGGYHHYWEHAYPAYAVVCAVPLTALGYALFASLPLALVVSIGALLGVFPLYRGEHDYLVNTLVRAVPLAALGYGLLARFRARFTVPSFLLRPMKPWMIPLSLSLVAAWSPPSPSTPNLHRANVEGLADLLHDDWRWDWTAVTRELRVSYKAILLDYLSTMIPDWQQEEGGIDPLRPHEPLVVIEVDRQRVPDPLPSGWIAVSRGVRFTLLAIPTGSSLDWGSLMTCFVNVRGQETCHGSSNHHNLLRFMDKSVAAEIRSVTRRVPWHGKPGETEKIFLPRRLLLCRGRIESGPPGTRIAEDGQIAYVSEPGDIVFKWTPRTQGCEQWLYWKEDDPFVVAGDPATVDVIRGLIDQGRP